MDIYANSGPKSDYRSTGSAESSDSYEDIYVNEDVLETNETRSHKGTLTSGTHTWLMLMCLLTLATLASM